MPNVTSRLQGLSEGLAVKVPCKAVSLNNITLSGEQTINTTPCVEGDYVLLAGQTDSKFNGIWIVSTGQWTRRKDFDGKNDIVKGTTVFVTEGFGGNYFYQVTSEAPVIGTDPINFEIVRYDSEIQAGLAADYAEEASISASLSQSFAIEAQNAANQINDSLLGTSTTNQSVSIASKVFSTQSDLAFGVGSYVLIVSAAAPTTKVMGGQVTAYSGINLTVNVDYTSGSGSAADWIIRVSGARGATGATGPAGSGSGDMLKSENLSGLPSYVTARSNLGLGTAATASASSFATSAQGTKADTALQPADKTAANGMSMVLLETQDASSSAYIDFLSKITSSYDEYIFTMQDLVFSSNNVDLRFRTSTVNGAAGVFDSGASDYFQCGVQSLSDGASASFSSIGDAVIFANGIGNGTGLSLNGKLELSNPLGTTLFKTGMFHTTYGIYNSHQGNIQGSFRRNDLADVDAVRFYPSSGNIVSGKIRMYGRRKV